MIANPVPKIAASTKNSADVADPSVINPTIAHAKPSISKNTATAFPSLLLCKRSISRASRRIVRKLLRYPPALTRVEARTLYEAAFYAGHGFRVEGPDRSGRVFMVRDA